MSNKIEERLYKIFNEILKENIVKLEKNEDSTDGNVYIIDSKFNKYVAKIYKDKIHAKSMVALHQKLHSLNLNIPNIIYNDLKEKNDEYIVVYSFIKGKQISEILQDGKVNEEIILCISRKIRQMHDVTYGDNEFNLPNLPFEAYNQRKTLLHFDLTKNNIFLDENNDIAIIDFDDAKYGSAVYDISILISTFFFSKKRGIDIDGMEKFVDNYYGKDENLKRYEVPLIKTCAIQWINYLLDENKINESLVDSFNTKIKLINENL